MSRYRLLTALLTVFALAFAQIAVAMHSCSVHERNPVSEVPAQPAACHGAQAPEEAPGNDTLCAEHCQYGSASFDNSQSYPAAVNKSGPTLRVELADAAQSPDLRPSWRLAPAAAPPPAAILFGVLRI